MKRTIPVILTLFISVLFVGCLDNTPPLESYLAFGTVENPNKNTTFFFRLDDNTLLWVTSNQIENFKPDDGQRLLIEFNIIEDKREDGEYDYDIQLNRVREMLTKDIFHITPETQDSIGNDPVHVQNIWIGSKYLNVYFAYNYMNATHYINLVSDAEKTYDDGKIHLEFRHNANNDYPMYNGFGYASFDISSLQNEEADSVQIVVHVNAMDKEGEELFKLAYKYRESEESEELEVPQRTYIPKFSDLIPLDEIK